MLSKFPAGKSIFIDSNIFIYHFLGIIDACTQFLSRTESGEIKAFTSAIVMAEVWHRLMLAEVIARYNLTPKKAISYLKNHPESVQQLTRCSGAISAIPKMRVKILGVTNRALIIAQGISQKFGLLANDAINLALMRLHHIQNIATNDADFLRAKRLKVWRTT